jgi:plastocyanin
MKKHLNLKSDIEGKVSTGVLLSGFSAIILASILSTAAAQLGMSPIESVGERVLPTYIASIIPGASTGDNLQHYYPENIAIPVGITVAWSNNDPGQPHTVTSDLENSLDKGMVFNSGIIPFTSLFQYTFAKSGEYIYHCDIHPWRLGKVSVSDALERGNNLVMTSGTGPNFDLTKNDRTLLVFRPTTITVHETTPLTYNITITSKDNATAFSREFFALGNDLQLEIISTNTTGVSVYGPDFSDPITGTYHAQGNFLKPNTEYEITAEITAIGSQKPQNTISDTFVMKVTS